MYDIMNNYFWSSLINKPAVTIFILCSYLLQIQTSSAIDWRPVIVDLDQIVESNSEIDASLYTADLNYPVTCNISVVKCFFLELQVLLHESKIGGDEEFHDNVNRVFRSVNKFLSGHQGSETSQCRECETFEEKTYTEFIKDFTVVARRFNKEEHPKSVK
ncbi:interleukin-15 isoform X2 [Elgaria multicarinata webbii]